jgi:hypothetical protein
VGDESPQDIGALLSEICAGLVECDVPLLYCGANIVDMASEPRSLSLTR